MIHNKKISLIVPCKNEANIIAGFILRVPKYVDEIIIVDNNSTDNSKAIAKKAGAIVLSEPRHIGGIGYGFAHMTGMAKATGDYIVGMDGDDTYPVKKIKSIIKLMESKKYDVISCNRLPLKNAKAISPIRRLGINLLNAEVQWLFGYKIRDILTGMWVLRRDALPKINPTKGDWNLSIEMKLNAITNRAIRFSEYHINHFERKGNPSKQNLLKTGVTHSVFIVVMWVKYLGKLITQLYQTIQKPESAVKYRNI